MDDEITTAVDDVEIEEAGDEQDRADRFTWGSGDVVWTAFPNGRGAIIELDQRVKFKDGEGVVKAFGDNGLVTVEGPGESIFAVKVGDLDPA